MTQAFYDTLAPFYHLLYADWDAAICKQAAALDSLLQQLGVIRGGRVLDAACGIGTQTLGLATSGYQLDASDLSPGALARLIIEARNRGLTVHAYVDDLRTLAAAASESMDAVIACDNSLPHLLNDDDLLASFKRTLEVLKPAGVAIYSVRDYAAIERVTPEVRPYGLRYEGDDRFMVTHVWEWEGDYYDLRMYLTRETVTGDCTTSVTVTRYYAVTIERLMQLMARAGFINIARHDDILFQPVIVGRRGGERTR